MPIFTLEAQEGRLFCAARLHQDLRDGGRGRARRHAGPGADGLPDPRAHPGRAPQSAQPLADRASTGRCSTRVLRLSEAHHRCWRAVCSRSTLWPLPRLGGEFMPPLDEGDLLYMPTALPGIVRRQGGGAAAADRPADQDRAGSRDACSARSAARKPRPIRRRSRCSRRRSSSSRASNGGRA